eukprot:4143979-Prymnesium_polylepis.1
MRLGHLEAGGRLVLVELLAAAEFHLQIQAVALERREAGEVGQQIAVGAVVVPQRLPQQGDDVTVARGRQLLCRGLHHIGAAALGRRLTAALLLAAAASDLGHCVAD